MRVGMCVCALCALNTKLNFPAADSLLGKLTNFTAVGKAIMKKIGEKLL